MTDGAATEPTWDERVAAFWCHVDVDQPQQALLEMVQLLLDAPEDSSAGLFEWARLHEFLGRDEEAGRQYRTALDGTLDPERRERAIVQRADSLRNAVRPDDASTLPEV